MSSFYRALHIFLLLISPSLSGASLFPDLDRQYPRWPSSKKHQLHHTLIESIIDLYERPFYNREKYPPGQKECLYGGWLSRKDNNICRHPGSVIVRNKISPPYGLCGLYGVHRCNPLLFGLDDTNSFPGSNPGVGPCIQLSGHTAPSRMVLPCFKKTYLDENGVLDKTKVANHLETLLEHPSLLREYLQLARTVVRFCQVQDDKFCTRASNCKQLEEILYGEGDFWNSICYPVDYILDKREEFLAHGKRVCLQKKHFFENELLQQTTWKHFDLEERAKKVYQLAQESYNDIKQSTIRLTKKEWSPRRGAFSYRERIDGHIFHSDANPIYATCFAFQESQSVNPFSYNYTYCNSKMISSAYGLGQILRSTLRQFLDKKNGRNYLPLITPEGKKFRGMNYQTMYRAMGISPKFHMELVLRIINEMAKYRNNKLKDAYRLKHLIAAYSEAPTGRYVKSVRTCIDCLQAEQPPSVCYRRVRSFDRRDLTDKNVEE